MLSSFMPPSLPNLSSSSMDLELYAMLASLGLPASIRTTTSWQSGKTEDPLEARGCRPSCPTSRRALDEFFNKSSRPTAKNSKPFSPFVVLAFERLRLVLRRKRADPLLLLYRHCCNFHLSFHSSLRSCKFLLCRLSLSLSFRCSGFGILYSLGQLIHASQDLLHALPALTTARRSHDRPHNTSPSNEAPLPLMSSNNSSAVDRVICFFQAHGLSENSLCMCTQV